MIFAGGVTVTSVFFDSLAGYAFARMRFKGRGKLFALILMTMMVPAQILLIPLFLEVYLFGLLDTFAGLILPKMTSAFGIFMMSSFYVTLPKGPGGGGADRRAERIRHLPAHHGAPGKAGADLAGDLLADRLLERPDLPDDHDQLHVHAHAARGPGAVHRRSHVFPTVRAIAGSMLSMLPLLIVYMFRAKILRRGASPWPD